ncbi:MAG: S9 family peptidase [Arcanobacterium sp.]
MSGVSWAVIGDAIKLASMTIPHPPRAAKKPSTRIFHDDVVVENYQWMRNENDPDVLEHVRAENAWFEQNTAHLADLRARLVSEFAGYTKETDVSVPRRIGDYWYWTRTWEGKAYPALFRCAVEHPAVRPQVMARPYGEPAAGAEPAAGGEPVVDGEPAAGVDSVPETVVYDGNVLAEGQDFFAVGARAISPDGRLLALAVDTSGNEYFTLRISEIDSGEVVEEKLENIGYGLVFSADGRVVFYTRMDDAWRTYQVWAHRIGEDPANDRLLFEEKDELFSLAIGRSRDGQWLMVHSESRTTTEVHLFSTVDPERYFTVCERSADLDYSVEVAGDGLFIIHNRDNIGFDLAWAPVAPSTPDEWVKIDGAGDGERFTGMSAFRDFAVLAYRSGGQMRLRAYPRVAGAGSGAVAGVEPTEPTGVTATEPITPNDTETHVAAASGWGTPVVIPAEELSTITLWGNANWDAREVNFMTESLLTPDSFHSYSIDTGEVTTLKVTEVPGYDRGKYVQYWAWARATDGTEIPLTIAHRADLDRQGKNPGLIEGYGSYEISNDPWFVTSNISLLERGVVLAVAHIRGGGEMGRAWYDQGKLLAKRNTFTDFVDSARYLVDIGLVDADRLAAEGGSAGGLLMGAATNLAPELFRVVHARVPFVDALTTILDPSLPLTVGEWEEWGNPVESAEVYHYMKSYSPTENVRAVEYPAILASTSVNDIRVSFTEPTKWIQVLRDYATNDEVKRPILQYTELAGGHAGGSGRYRRWENRARQLAFILDQIGVD